MATGQFAPKAERVIYRQNPLRSVICQLVFPPILSIESTLPAAFQERIRGDFPLFVEGADRDELALPPSIAQMIPDEMRQALLSAGKRKYRFASKDKAWSAHLSRDSLALETKQYQRWETFCARLRQIVDALISVYSPDSFGRLGLRYQNVIDRDVLGLGPMPWRELLSPVALGPLDRQDLAPQVEEHNGVFSLRMNDAGDVIRAQYGLARADEATDGVAFWLDNDLFTNHELPAEVDHVIQRASEFNRFNRGFFRWCILEPLHAAMGPEPAA